jgi:hypothetical protein
MYPTKTRLERTSFRVRTQRATEREEKGGPPTARLPAGQETRARRLLRRRTGRRRRVTCRDWSTNCKIR